MICKNCGNMVNNTAKYCPICGGTVNNDTANKSTDTAKTETFSWETYVEEPKNTKSKKKGFKKVLLAAAIIVVLIVCINGLSSGTSSDKNSTSAGSGTTQTSTSKKTQQVKEDPPVQLKAPQIKDEWVDGEVYCLVWSEVSDAAGYEVSLNGNTSSISGNSYEFTVKQGSTYDFKVRAVGNSAKITDSDWTTETISIPTYDYTNLGEVDASALSLSQLKEWATAKGYEYSVSKGDDFTTLSMEFEDEKNSGLGNAVVRGIVGFFDGGADAGTKAVNELPSTFKNHILSDNSLKDAVKGQAEETLLSMVLGGASNAWNYAWMDTKIHINYVYKNDSLDRAAYYGSQSMMEEGHSSLKTNCMEEYNKVDNDTCYYHIGETNRDIYVCFSEDTTNESYPRWMIYFYAY
jgi:hypothetical protein